MTREIEVRNGTAVWHLGEFGEISISLTWFEETSWHIRSRLLGLGAGQRYLCRRIARCFPAGFAWY